MTKVLFKSYIIRYDYNEWRKQVMLELTTLLWYEAHFVSP